MSVSPISSLTVARRSLLTGGLGTIFAKSMWGRSLAAADTDTASDPSAHLAAINELAQAGTEEGQPYALLAKLDRALERAVGHKLFTVLVLNEEVGQNQRYYSNQPKDYPVGGSKQWKSLTERSRHWAGYYCRAAGVSAMAVCKVACEGGQVIAASSMSRMFSMVKGWPHRRLLLVFRDSSAASCADRTALE